MIGRNCLQLLVCVLALLYAAPIYSATNEELAAGLSRLFTAAASPSLSAQAAVDEQFQALQRLAPGDRRVAYAHAVAKINQRQYRDADRTIDPLLEQDDSDLNLRRTRIWLSTILKDYAAALHHLEQLGEGVASAEPLDSETAVHHARFLGRVFAFLEGPAADVAPPRQVTGSKNRVLERLAASQRVAFEDAYDAVTDQFFTLTETKEESVERAQQEAAEQRDAQLRDIAGERERLADRRGDLQERRDRLQSELADQRDAANKADQTLLTQLTRLQSQAAVIGRELASINASLFRLDRLIEQETDPFLRDRYIREASRLEVIARRYSFDLAGIESQAVGVNTQRAQLRRQQLEAERTFGSQLTEASKELGGLQQREKRTDIVERRAQRTRPTSSQARALTAQATAFTTYEPFPFEQERQRILEALK